jgi:acyl-CoA synthetase (AMP-forming)/AMP-acid ligase II
MDAALCFEDREYSVGELEALAGGLARRLASQGAASGDRVAVMSSNRPEFVIAMLAIWRLGAAAVLISPAWKQTELDHALAITQPRHAVGDHPLLAERMPAMVHLDEPIQPAAGPDPVHDAAQDAVLVFSSGTTGLPKAVRHTHGSLNAAVGHWRDALKLTGKDRIQIATPPSHILGLLNIVTALRTGTWMRLHRRFDLDLVLAAIEADRITLEMAVAPIALAMASHPRLEDYDLTSLRYIMWGATPVTRSVAETVTKRTGVEWLPAYGASELPVITCNPIGNPRLDSVGRPVPGVLLRVADLDTGEPLPPGESGEIQARSPSLMSGYLPDEANQDAFADGWYRTGDVGHIDPGGWVRLTDRRKEMIKVRAFQVAPAEIEGVLLGHPDIADCVVFGVPDANDGEAIIAAVTPRAPVDTDKLVAYIGERMASYKRPARVLVVDAIPRLPSGKALRRLLRDQYPESHGRTADT